MKLGSLELGRFIAAALVVISHTAPTANNYAATPAQRILPHFDVGPLGVSYFFVLSGFVMASNHVQDFGRLAAVPKFLWRRICRIYPVFWLAMLIPCYYQFSTLNPHIAAQLLSLVPVNTSELLPPAWTLRYEVAFYLMFSLCLLPYIGRPLLVAWMLIVLWSWSPCGVLRHVLPHPPSLLTYLANSQANHFDNFDEFYFFAGIIGGLLFARTRPTARVTLALLAASIAAFLIGLAHIQWGAIYGSPDMILVMGLIIATLMLSLARLETLNLLRLGKTAERLGAISYPLYILHWSLFLLAQNTIPPLKLNKPAVTLLFLAFTATTIATAAAVTFAFDQPVHRWLRRLGRGHERPGGSAPWTPAKG
jgi:peptidoglycan/LPS O-acetylase OafA/YrhL